MSDVTFASAIALVVTAFPAIFVLVIASFAIFAVVIAPSAIVADILSSKLPSPSNAAAVITPVVLILASPVIVPVVIVFPETFPAVVIVAKLVSGRDPVTCDAKFTLFVVVDIVFQSCVPVWFILFK